MLRRSWFLIFTPVILIGGCTAGFIIFEKRAETKAREFCERIKVGNDFEQAIQLINSTDADRKSLEEKDHAFIMYSGLDPFSRHFCDIKSSNGKVTSASYSYLD